MRGFVFLLALAVVMFDLVGLGLAGEVWQPMAGIKESDIKEVIIKEGIIYASSEKRLYRSEDYGKTWKAVFSARGDANTINFVDVSGQGLFVCTEKGVFRSLNGKSAWKRIFKGVGTEENSAQHIAFSQGGTIYIGTKAGLFLSSDNGATWGKDHGEAGNLSVEWIVFHKDNVFLAAEKGVYRGSDGNWKRVFVTSTEEVEYDSDAIDTAVSAERPVNSIMPNANLLFIATDAGIFVSGDGGDNWKRFVSDGLISQKVERILFKGDLFAATDNGVFIFSDKDNAWKALYKGMAGRKANSIAGDSKGNIWVATNKGLYRSTAKVLSAAQGAAATTSNVVAPSYLSRAAHSTSLRVVPSKSRGTKSRDGAEQEENVLKQFAHEPGIRDVQEIAIEYAEVHPDKIKKWREAARRKALLPDVSLGLDRYVTDLYHWDAGQNPDVLQTGDDVITWDVTMSWDLGDLVWSTDQTSIDTRSRLMVQLRDDILDEITRTYFERRRLQLEMHLSPSSDLQQRLEKGLRIEELTADLDAMTGGYFSAQLK